MKAFNIHSNDYGTGMFSMYFNKLTMAEVMKPHVSHQDWIRISKSLFGLRESVRLTVEVFHIIYFKYNSAFMPSDTKTMGRLDNKNEYPVKLGASSIDLKWSHAILAQKSHYI